MSLINRYNYLRWDDGEPAASIESDLPNGYIRDRSRCDYKPLLVPAEAMRFYINTDVGLAWADDPNTHKLALLNEQGTVIDADIAPLQVHNFQTVPSILRTYYAEVIIDSSVTPGTYYLQIRTAADVVKLTSNKIQVVATTSDYRNNTVLAKFRHDRYFYGINYHDVATFYQQFRIHLNKNDMQFEGEKEVYSEVTSGKKRTFNNFMHQTAKVEAYYFDELAHEAAAVMFDHDELYLNLKRYTPKGVYKVNFDPVSKVFKAEMELFKEEFSTANRCTA